MGYDLHVTRARNWTENTGFEISEGEWSDLVRSDPELESDVPLGANAALWKSENGEVRGWFDWYSGTVFTTNPDRDTLGKLLDLAQKLGARVQGDEGELYKTTDDWRSVVS